VLVGSSPRGSLALMLLSRAAAALAGRDYVIPEDVKRVAKPALSHRLTLKPEVWLRRVDPSSVVADIVAKTPTPTSGAMPSYATGTATGGTGTRPPVDSDDEYRYAPPRG